MNDVILAWGQAWCAEPGACVQRAGCGCLEDSARVSIKVDAQTRVLQKTVIEGVLSVPAEHCAVPAWPS
jgi:glutamate dehydrogenase